MLLIAPKGVTSVSLAGKEYKVQKGEVEVPDQIGAALLDHGLTVKIVDEEEQELKPEPEPELNGSDKDPANPPNESDHNEDPPSDPPNPSGGKNVKNAAAAGDDKNGK